MILFLYCKHCSNCNAKTQSSLSWLPEDNLIVVQNNELLSENYTDGFGAKAVRFIDTTEALRKYGFYGAENRLYIMKDGDIKEWYSLTTKNINTLKLRFSSSQ
jgi:hypothetical protein